MSQDGNELSPYSNGDPGFHYTHAASENASGNDQSTLYTGPQSEPYTPAPGVPYAQVYTPATEENIKARAADRKRTGGLVVLAIALLIVLGVGIFAGWQFTKSNQTGQTGTSSSSSAVTSTVRTTAANTTSVDTTSSIQTQQEATIAKIEPAVVELDVITNSGKAIGSGVIIDNKGDIITNNHVVDGQQSIKAILNNGSTEVAQLVGTAAADDLAVVKIKPFANMTVATIGDSSKLVVGQEVLAIGNPLGITETATSGIISALNRKVQESSSVTINNAIQTDAPINPGNSGGALITLNGQLIGIPTLAAIDSETNSVANNIGFAISSTTVKADINKIIAA